MDIGDDGWWRLVERRPEIDAQYGVLEQKTVPRRLGFEIGGWLIGCEYLRGLEWHW